MTTTFGQMIKNGRHWIGLSQREAGARLGVNYTYISKLEHDVGEFSASDGLIQRMADLYGLPADELFILAGKCPPDLLMVMSNNLPFVNAVRALLPAPPDVPT